MPIRIDIETSQANQNLVRLGQALVGITQKTEKVSRNSVDLSKDFQKLSQQTGITESSLKKLEDRYSRGLQADKTNRAIKELTKTMNLSRGETARLQSRLGDFEGSLRTLSAGAHSVTGNISKLQTTLVAFGAYKVLQNAVNSFAEFDRGLIGISKTTNITGTALSDLGKDIQKLSLEIPVAKGELLSIAKSAGQLGVHGADNILKFAKTVGQLGLATNLVGDDAASALARILTITGEAASNVDVLGSAIVSLGNNMATTESEIARVALQVGQATAEFGLSSAEVVAISATMRAIGVRAELGGSAIGRALRGIRRSLDQGGEGLIELQKLTGMTGDELERTFQKNAVQVFYKFSEGLGQAIRSGQSASSVLEKFNLRGEEILKVIPTIALRSSELGKALNLANAEVENSTALTREAIAASKSFSAQMQLINNRLDVTAVAFGERLAPAILEISDAFADFVEKDGQKITQFGEDMKQIIFQVSNVLRVTGEGFSSLPEEVQSMGLVTALLFGPKGIAVLGSVSFLAERFGNIGKALGLIKLGLMDFGDFASANGEELEKLVNKYNEITVKEARILDLRKQARNKFYTEDKLVYEREAQSLEAEVLADRIRLREAAGEAELTRLRKEAKARAEAAEGKKKEEEEVVKREKQASAEIMKVRESIRLQTAANEQLSFEASLKLIEAKSDAFRRRARGDAEALSLVDEYEITSYSKIASERAKQDTKSIKNIRDRYEQELALIDQYYNEIRAKHVHDTNQQIKLEEQRAKALSETRRRRDEEFEKERVEAVKKRGESEIDEEKKRIQEAIDLRNKSGNGDIKLQKIRLEQQRRLSLSFARTEEERLSINRNIDKQIWALDKETTARRIASAEMFYDYSKLRLREDLGLNKSTLEKELEQWEDLYESVGDLVKNVKDGIHKEFKGLFSGLMKGEIKSFESFFQGFLDSMVDSFVDAISDMAAKYVTSQLFEVGGSLLSSLPFFHDGTKGIKSNELLAVLKQGEMVVPDKQAKAINDAIGGNGMSKGDFFNRVTDAVQSVYGSSSDMFGTSAMAGLAKKSQRADIMGAFTGGLQGALFSGAAAAYGAYNQSLSVGRSLQSNYPGLSSDQIEGWAVGNAKNAMLSTGIQSFAGQFGSGVLSSALGVSDPGLGSFNISTPFGGTKISIGKLASTAITTGLSVLGGFANPLAGAVLGPAVNMGISAIADAFNMRDMEDLRDMFEDRYGFIGGRVAMQSIEGHITDLGPYADKLGYKYSMVDPITHRPLTFATAVDLVDHYASQSKAIQGIVDPISKALQMSHWYGLDYTSGVWGSDNTRDQASLAGAVERDPGYFGYDSRRRAAAILGRNIVTGTKVVTPLGQIYDRSDFASQGEYGFGGRGTFAEGSGRTGLGYGGDFGGGHFGSDDGSESSSIGGKEGHGADMGGGHFGADSDNDNDAAFAKGGYVGSLMVPKGEDGMAGLRYGEFVVQKSAVDAVGVDTLQSINQGIVPGGNLILQVVTTDGRVLTEKIIGNLKQLSEEGTAIIHTDGIYSMR